MTCRAQARRWHAGGGLIPATRTLSSVRLTGEQKGWTTRREPDRLLGGPRSVVHQTDFPLPGPIERTTQQPSRNVERRSFGKTVQSAVWSTAASCALVGKPCNPCPVSYRRHDKLAAPAGGGKGSCPSMRMVGEPWKPSCSASASELTTCVATATSLRPESSASSRSLSGARFGQSSVCRTVIFMAYLLH